MSGGGSAGDATRLTVDGLRELRDGADLEDVERGYARAASRAADSAHPVFVANGWEWGYEQPRVPTWGEMYNVLLDAIRKVGNRELALWESGRFCVAREFEGGADLFGDNVRVFLELSECEARGAEGDAT